MIKKNEIDGRLITHADTWCFYDFFGHKPDKNGEEPAKLRVFVFFGKQTLINQKASRKKHSSQQYEW